MIEERPLANACRVTSTGSYLISTAYQGNRHLQFAFRDLGLGDEPPLLLIGIQDKNFNREVIQKNREFAINVCSANQMRAVDKSRDLEIEYRRRGQRSAGDAKIIHGVSRISNEDEEIGRKKRKVHKQALHERRFFRAEHDPESHVDIHPYSSPARCDKTVVAPKLSCEVRTDRSPRPND